jgi:hypothetical protein
MFALPTIFTITLPAYHVKPFAKLAIQAQIA